MRKKINKDKKRNRKMKVYLSNERLLPHHAHTPERVR